MAVLYLLDTNILVHQVRRDAVGERIRQLYAPLLAEPQPLISVVTEGELRSLGFQVGWGQEKTDKDFDHLDGRFINREWVDPLAEKEVDRNRA